MISLETYVSIKTCTMVTYVKYFGNVLIKISNLGHAKSFIFYLHCCCAWLNVFVKRMQYLPYNFFENIYY